MGEKRCIKYNGQLVFITTRQQSLHGTSLGWFVLQELGPLGQFQERNAFSDFCDIERCKFYHSLPPTQEHWGMYIGALLYRKSFAEAPSIPSFLSSTPPPVRAHPQQIERGADDRLLPNNKYTSLQQLVLNNQ